MPPKAQPSPKSPAGGPATGPAKPAGSAKPAATSPKPRQPSAPRAGAKTPGQTHPAARKRKEDLVNKHNPGPAPSRSSASGTSGAAPAGPISPPRLPASAYSKVGDRTYSAVAKSPPRQLSPMAPSPSPLSDLTPSKSPSPAATVALLPAATVDPPPAPAAESTGRLTRSKSIIIPGSEPQTVAPAAGPSTKPPADVQKRVSSTPAPAAASAASSSATAVIPTVGKGKDKAQPENKPQPKAKAKSTKSKPQPKAKSPPSRAAALTGTPGQDQSFADDLFGPDPAPASTSKEAHAEGSRRIPPPADPHPSSPPSGSPAPSQHPDEDEDYSQTRKDQMLHDLPPPIVSFSARPTGGVKRADLTDGDKLELSKLRIKPVPCHSDDTNRKKPQPKPAKDKVEDDGARFCHSEANHTTIGKAIFMLPFDIYECLPFFRALDALGKEYAETFPPRDILDDALASMEGPNHSEYDRYIDEAQLYFDRAKAAEDAGDDTSFKKSSSVFLGDYHKEFFKYPIVEIVPPKQPNQAANAAVKKKNSFEKKQKKATEGGESSKKTKAKGAKGKKGKGKGKAVDPDPSLTASPAPDSSTLPDIPENEPDEVDWEQAFTETNAPDLSSTIKPSYRQTRLYGTTDTSTYPPAVVDFYARAMKHIQHVFAVSFERVLKENNKLQSQLPPSVRKDKLRKKDTEVKPNLNYGSEYELAALQACFGGWAVNLVDDTASYATGPPGQPIIQGYRERLNRFINQVKGYVARNDRNRLVNIYAVDKDWAIAITHHVASIMGNTLDRKIIPELVRLFSKYQAEYRRYFAQPSTSYQMLAEKFWPQASSYDAMPAAEFAALPLHLRNEITNIRAAYASHQISVKEALVKEKEEAEITEQHLLHDAASAGTSHQKKMADEEDNDILLDSAAVFSSKSDFGVSHYSQWDAWDFVVYFGIEHLQDKDRAQLVKTMSKAEAHRRELDDTGVPKLSPSGDFIFVNPDHHLARSEIVVPGLNRLEPTPIDQTAWDQAVQDAASRNEEAERTPENHARIVPSVHQLAGVANILARGYLHQDYSLDNSGTLLADDVGVGKTLQGFMTMAMLRFYATNQDHYRQTPAPVHVGWKSEWCLDQEDPQRSKVYTPAEIKEMGVEWIGDSRFNAYLDSNKRILNGIAPLTVSLFVSTPTVITSQLEEANRFLDPRLFHVCHFTSAVRADRTKQTDFLHDVELNAKSRHVVMLVSFNTLSSVAGDVSESSDNRSEPQSKAVSLLRTSWVWSFMFVDEVHYMRNPESQASLNLQRFCAKAMVTVGATATPIWNGPLDIINLFKALLHPAVRRGHEPGPESGPDEETSDWLDSVVKMERNWKKLSKERNTAVAKANVALTKALKTATGSERLQLIARREKLKADWLKDAEDSSEARSEGEKSDMETRNAWRLRLKSEVIDVIIKVASPYMIRRTAQSTDYLGSKVVDLPPTIEKERNVTLSSSETADRARFKASIDEGSGKNFAVLMRQYNLDPYFVEHGYMDPGSHPSAKMVQVLLDVTEWYKENIVDDERESDKPFFERQLKPVDEQTKMIIHTIWTSMVEMIQARLHQFGFYAAVMSGQTSPLDRKMLNIAFQQDDDHLSSSFAYTDAEGKLKIVQSRPCRLMIITSVANAGINLFRASHMCLGGVTYPSGGGGGLR